MHQKPFSYKLYEKKKTIISHTNGKFYAGEYKLLRKVTKHGTMFISTYYFYSNKRPLAGCSSIRGYIHKYLWFQTIRVGPADKQ